MFDMPLFPRPCHSVFFPDLYRHRLQIVSMRNPPSLAILLDQSSQPRGASAGRHGIRGEVVDGCSRTSCPMETLPTRSDGKRLMADDCLLHADDRNVSPGVEQLP